MTGAMTCAKPLVPFFVADRPASLRILRGIQTNAYAGPLGIMTHANTTENFRALLREFPCGALHPKGKHDAECKEIRRLGVVKFCDSGVFTKEGCSLDYDELFLRYESMGVQYGIIIDWMRNPKKTLRSARTGLAEYRTKKRSFSLVGVAQGRSVSEYLRCYRGLKALGYEHIAVGGLLKRRKNTSHYVHVRGNGVLYDVLEAIRSEYPDDWLFALGCYHPNRHQRLQHLGLYGSDYKGWIFNYKPLRHVSLSEARISRYAQVRTFLRTEVLDYPLFQVTRGGRAPKSDSATRTLVVVACGSKKVWDESPRAGAVQARNVYVGRFFSLNRAYAERFGTDWAILSAKHGLVRPTDRIGSNYDVRLGRHKGVLSGSGLRRQVVSNGYHSFARVVVLGGRHYGQAISDAFVGTGIAVLRPLERYAGIGYMSAAVQSALVSGSPLC